MYKRETERCKKKGSLKSLSLHDCKSWVVFYAVIQCIFTELLAIEARNLQLGCYVVLLATTVHKRAVVKQPTLVYSHSIPFLCGQLTDIECSVDWIRQRHHSSTRAAMRGKERWFDCGCCSQLVKLAASLPSRLKASQGLPQWLQGLPQTLGYWTCLDDEFAANFTSWE